MTIFQEKASQGKVAEADSPFKSSELRLSFLKHSLGQIGQRST